MNTSAPSVIVVDGNFFLYRAFHVCRGASARDRGGGKMDFVADPEADAAFLRRKLAEELSSTVSKLKGVYAGVVYCTDSKSWRKGASKTFEYKGNREKDEKIDWDGVFSTHDDFVERIREAGVETMSLDGCEGDDLAFGWSDSLMESGKNCIVASGDGDMVQLARRGSGNPVTFTLVYNREKIVAPLGFSEALKEGPPANEGGSIFDMTSSVENLHSSYQRLAKELSVEEVDADRFVLSKVLSGDRKDNVPPVLKSGGKSVGPKTAEKIVDRVVDSQSKVQMKKDPKLDPFDENLVSECCRSAVSTLGLNERVEEVKDRFRENRNILALDARSLPEGLLDDVRKSILYVFPKPSSDISDRDRLFEHVGVEPGGGSEASDIFSAFGAE